FCDEAALLRGGEQALADLVRFLVEFTTGYELKYTEGGAVERIIAAAVLGHGGELVAFGSERGAAVNRTSWYRCFARFGIAVALAIGFATALGAHLDPARAPHDLAGLVDEAARQWLVN